MGASRVLSLIFLVVALSCNNAMGFKQELWLYMEGGNGLYFDTNTPDLSKYSELLTEVNKICTIGKWFAYDSVNYGNDIYNLGHAGLTEPQCLPISNGAAIKSIRHLAAADTSVDTLSLYPVKRIVGTETQITSKALTGISTPTASLAATGTSDWMLFEGQVLDGPSLCYEVPQNDWFISYNTTLPMKISTVGSVFKGCDLVEIQAYKTKNLLA